MKSSLKWWPIKLALLVLTLWLVSRKIDVHTLGPLLWHSHWAWVGICLVMQIIAAYLNALRWRTLWNERGLPLRKYLYFVFVGYFFNFFLPSAMLSEAIRVVAFGRKYQAVQANIGVNILARTIGASILGGLGLLGIIVIGPELWRRHALERLQPSSVQMGFLGLAVFFLVVISTVFGKRIFAMPWAKSMFQAASDTKLVGKVFSLSFGIQAVTLFGTYALFKSVNTPVSPWQVALFVSIVQFVLLFPVSFGGIGVREYLNLLLFSEIAGLSTEAVLAASLLAYIPLVLMAMTGGFWMVFRKSRV